MSIVTIRTLKGLKIFNLISFKLKLPLKMFIYYLKMGEIKINNIF